MPTRLSAAPSMALAPAMTAGLDRSAGGGTYLIVDLGGVTFIDASGWRAGPRLQHRCKREHEAQASPPERPHP